MNRPGSHADGLDELAARVGIERTLFRYAEALDELDLDVVAGCFAEDAVLVAGGGAHEGREEIRGYYARVRAGQTEQGQHLRHLTTNVTIEFSDDGTASVRSFFAIAVTEAAGVSMRWAGVYRDVVVRESESWLLQRREIVVDRPPAG